jgi:ribosomal protein S18 acetylase RimI-like enzyme
MRRTVDVGAAATANLATHFTYAPRVVDGMRVREDAGVVLADSGLPCDTFNTACRARLPMETADPAIRDAIEWFSDAGRPFSWWVSPGDEPRDLGRRLEKAGLVAAETEVAMQLDLGGATLDAPVPIRFEIRRATTAAELTHFGAINAANWTPPDPHVVTFYELAAGVLLDPASPLRFYVGYLEGQPVAASELTLAGGMAGLYNISTLAAARGRGLGTAMTAAPLRDALAEGVPTAILQAAPDGVSIYRRLGFTAFGEITEYKPALPEAGEAAA